MTASFDSYSSMFNETTYNLDVSNLNLTGLTVNGLLKYLSGSLTTATANVDYVVPGSSPTFSGLTVGSLNGLIVGTSGVLSAITAGTSSQYLRGDNTYQTLNTDAVPAGSNLYFTNARAVSACSGTYELVIPASISSKYYRGDKTFVTLDTDAVPEGKINVYYTDARAKLSLTGDSPITYNSSTGHIGFSGPTGGVTSITGTANQVIASASTGAITLSLPQSIATSSDVRFNRIGLSGAVPGSSGCGAVAIDVSASYPAYTLNAGTSLVGAFSADSSLSTANIQLISHGDLKLLADIGQKVTINVSSGTCALTLNSSTFDVSGLSTFGDTITINKVSTQNYLKVQVSGVDQMYVGSYDATTTGGATISAQVGIMNINAPGITYLRYGWNQIAQVTSTGFKVVNGSLIIDNTASTEIPFLNYGRMTTTGYGAYGMVNEPSLAFGGAGYMYGEYHLPYYDSTNAGSYLTGIYVNGHSSLSSIAAETVGIDVLGLNVPSGYSCGVRINALPTGSSQRVGLRVATNSTATNKCATWTDDLVVGNTYTAPPANGIYSLGGINFGQSTLSYYKEELGLTATCTFNTTSPDVTVGQATITFNAQRIGSTVILSILKFTFVGNGTRTSYTFTIPSAYGANAARPQTMPAIVTNNSVNTVSGIRVTGTTINYYADLANLVVFNLASCGNFQQTTITYSVN